MDEALKNIVKEIIVDAIEDTMFPCVGAKAALSKSSLQVEVYQQPNDDTCRQLIHDLKSFELKRGKEHDDIYSSFVATFVNWKVNSEESYQSELWDFLQLLHDVDFAEGNAWAAEASHDVTSPFFGYSINERAYFLVGLHPYSSRVSRKVPWATVVFNSHYQFERLREMNIFEQLKQRIRRRDMRLQGSYNPEMVGTKEVSEARQYSGKVNGAGWMCPLVVKNVQQEKQEN